ncbi:hypothetical protein GCM10010910_16640 [Microbacterium nanhaiense]|uniref:DUF3618 domain-containing protein n=1 Tax=Microbacterium nanhaiense TaxID=1301026 RepID=A0ABQ2N0R9_9MICO|nr:hypothetical protein [Microbacterium nanhaiense]GGO63631.1 hypothetical protein GCM10010910_16640 [Microbacterium nanhaiense]
MSSELPDTVVPSGISDPVQLARAELKAALAAIEIKANYPRRIKEASGRIAAKARTIAEKKPVVALTGIVVGSAAVGSAVWGIARAISR